MDNMFGKMVVNDWPIYDGVGHDAKVVARAQGLRVQAGMKGSCWHNCFTIVFEEARFKGSTLQVMGTIIDNAEWAIVGGTGEFAMANGVIYKKLHKKKSEENIVELHLHAFYFPLRTGVSCWTLGV